MNLKIIPLSLLFQKEIQTLPKFLKLKADLVFFRNLKQSITRVVCRSLGATSFALDVNVGSMGHGGFSVYCRLIPTFMYIHPSYHDELNQNVEGCVNIVAQAPLWSMRKLRAVTPPQPLTNVLYERSILLCTAVLVYGCRAFLLYHHPTDAYEIRKKIMACSSCSNFPIYCCVVKLCHKF